MDFNFANVASSDDPDQCYKNFCDSISKHFNNSFPKTNCPIKGNKSPWFDVNLKQLLHKKDKLYKRYIIRKDEASKNTYHKYRNFYFRCVNDKKKNYFTKKFYSLRQDIKKTWNCINYLLGRSANSRTNLITLEHAGQVITDNKQAANIFNDYFSSIPSKLVQKLPQTTASFRQYLTSSNPSSLFLYPTSPQEIKSIIGNIKPKFSAGWDEMPSVILKYLPDMAVQCLCYIFNLSLSQGKFISFFKRAKIIPLYKRGDPKLVSNYRPISLLSSFSKILEKIVYNRLYSFLVRCNIFSNTQFGFRRGHSTSHATTYLIHKITEAFENKQSSLGIFLDLTKAFDTIDHTIMLHKLHHYGIRGTAFEWFKSYLSGRSQQVEISDRVLSDINFLNYSIPQGSILGPLLFIIYVNDFSSCLHYSSSVSFADDTSVLLSEKSLRTLYTKGNKELININNWLIANKMSINTDKTKYVLFRTANTKPPPTDLKLTIRSTVLEKVSSVRVLGLTINEHLSWKDHMNVLKTKLRSVLGAVLRVKPYLNKDTMLTLYHSLLMSNVRFCITNWCFGNKTIINQLQCICNKFIRMIFNLPRFESTQSVMAKNSLLTIDKLYRYEIALFMFKFHMKQLPSAFSDIFLMKKYSIGSRNNSNIIPMACRISLSQQSIRYVGPKIWNEVPPSIRKCKALSSFKSKLLVYFLNLN